MPPTEQDPVVAWLVTGAKMALSQVRGRERYDKICRHMSGWFAMQSQAVSADLEFEARKTPMLPPPEDEIPIIEGEPDE